MKHILALLSTAIVIRALFIYGDWFGLLAFMALAWIASDVLIAWGRELQSVSEWLDG